MIIFVQSFLCKFVHICLLILITKNLSLVYMLEVEADASLHYQLLNFMYFDHVCQQLNRFDYVVDSLKGKNPRERRNK